MRAAGAATAAQLADLVERFAGLKVAVLADLVVDEFIHGEIARVSREAPVLILEHDHTVIVPGGGGNAVANLAALDAVPFPVGIVGNDPSGLGLIEHFASLGLPTTGIRAEVGYDTPTKSRILAGGVHTRRQQVVRVDRGARHGELPAAATRSLTVRLRAALRMCPGLLVADYGYGAATPEMVRSALDARGRRPLTVTVDSRERVARYRGVWACTPNQEEVERALDLPPLRTEGAVEEAARRLLDCSRDRAVLVTRGAKGMSLVERRKPALHIPAFGSDEVADVTGAGDTVIAAFTLALLAGGSFSEAAILANVAAGLVVMKAGTATVSRAELTQAIEEGLTA